MSSDPADPADPATAPRPPGRWSPPPVVRAVLRVLALVAVVVAGAGAGWLLAPSATTVVGPLEVQVEVAPSLSSGVHVQLPPVGQVDFDTHTAPLAVDASVLSVDPGAARSLIESPEELLALQETAPEVLRAAVVEAAAWAATSALAGAVVALTLVYRRQRPVAAGTALVTAGVLALGGLTVATFDAGALQQPRFTGLLSRAPYVAGESASVVERLESYRSGLADFVQSVTTVYAVADRLPLLPRDTGTTRVLHVSDMHLNPLGFDVTERLVDEFAVDVVVDTGDITTWGSAVESTTLSRIGGLGVPYVFVRGNHDSLLTQAAVSAQPGAVVLDGDVAEVAGLTFAGIGDPVFTPDEDSLDGDDRLDRVGASVDDLANLVAAQDRRGGPVDIALVHDPSRLDALFGEVPLVLSGHYHRRIVRLDESGTRVMVQGSTGGAGLTSAGLRRLSEGAPLDLTATLLHVASEGRDAGRLVAYDEVTVGGLGLTSVTVSRTVVDPDEDPADS